MVDFGGFKSLEEFEYGIGSPEAKAAADAYEKRLVLEEKQRIEKLDREQKQQQERRLSGKRKFLMVSSYEEVELYPSELDQDFVKVVTKTPRGFKNVVWCTPDKETLVKETISNNLRYIGVFDKPQFGTMYLQYSKI